MKDIKSLVKDIERDLVVNIVMGVRYRRITLTEAKEISQKFMARFPYRDHESLFEYLYLLSEKHKAVRRVYVKYAPGYEDEVRSNILKTMRIYMNKNDFENAIKTANGHRSVKASGLGGGRYG